MVLEQPPQEAGDQQEVLAEDSAVDDAPGWGGVTLALNLASPAAVDAITEGPAPPAPRSAATAGSGCSEALAPNVPGWCP